MPSEKCFRRHFLIADMLTDDIGTHDHADVERACLTVVLSALQRLLVEVAVEAGTLRPPSLPAACWNLRAALIRARSQALESDLPTPSDG